ncbi:MAG: hypothetical protein ABJM06_00350 [Gilvibacter sp.]
MRIIIYGMAITMWLLSTVQIFGQDDQTTKQIELLTKSIEQIQQEEKEALKAEVMAINERLEANEITQDEADAQKRSAAERRALNIENRVAIVTNKIAFLERNGADSEATDRFEINLFGKGLLDFDYTPRKRKYDRRTTSDFVLAVGFNNAIEEGTSLEDSDFKIAGSRFAEIGWAWKTRVFDNTNWLRVKYGFSFMFNGLKPTDNRYFVDTGVQTELQTFDKDLDKSKFRVDNLVFPVHFEFGPSNKIEKEEYFRYNTHNKIKVGVGGYAGLRLASRQKLKFNDGGEEIKQKFKGNYNASNFVYGLSAYLGWRNTALYVKYDLNPIFKDNTTELRNISLGLRFDMD